MVWERLIGTKALEFGEFKNYLGARHGKERKDSDAETIYDRLGSETFHLLSQL